MHKLLFALTMSMSCFAFVSPAVAASQMDDVPELETCTLGRIPVNRFAIPTNTVQVIDALKTGVRAIETKADNTERNLANAVTRVEGVLTALEESLDGVSVTNGQIKIGRAAEIPSFEQPDGRVRPATAININPSVTYPSYAYGDFNINLGIDNIVGGTNGSSATKYSTTIGTSAKATQMHSYAYGSQINALKPNTTVIGYGGSATSEYSTVIGHGKRPSTVSVGGYDKNFNTWSEANTWLSTLREDVFPGVHFYVTGHDPCTITKILSEPNNNGHYYEYVQIAGGMDYIHGGYDWRYGKSHGPGTFNIVTYHPRWGTQSPGLKSVYINDDSLDDLITDTVGTKKLALTTAQRAKGITFTKNGYDENGAVEIGADAVATLDQGYVSSINKKTTLRNVSVAIGARAIATNKSSKIASQAVAIGYCATANHSNAIAIGAGARHLDDETDETGHNAVASGSCAIAVGYNAKAFSANGVAIGKSAKSTAENAVQIGEGVNTEANTLKFQGVTIVKNGYLAGGSANPQEVNMTETPDGEFAYDLTVDPGSVNTLLPTNSLDEGSELSVGVSDGLRNFEIYVPNEENLRNGMPVNVDLSYLKAENPDIKTVINGLDQAHRLPAKIKLIQPYAKLVILELTSMDDGTDWSPVITNCNLTWSTSTGKFTTTGTKLIEGSYLNSGTSLKLVYPISSTVSVTNDIRTIDNKTCMSGTFFNYTTADSYTPKSGEALYADSDGNTWYELIYTTVEGKTPAMFRKEFNALGL